jgi:NADH:ubiquinone oxidoreductase subunit F (NADH-binding)
VLLGGAAGVFVGPDALDVPLTFEGTRAIGATLGSGVVMVFDETADLVATLRRIAAFFRDEFEAYIEERRQASFLGTVEPSPELPLIQGALV